jgi:hypothetical protein
MSVGFVIIIKNSNLILARQTPKDADVVTGTRFAEASIVIDNEECRLRSEFKFKSDSWRLSPVFLFFNFSMKHGSDGVPSNSKSCRGCDNKTFSQYGSS